jgi:hypothetical protein
MLFDIFIRDPGTAVVQHSSILQPSPSRVVLSKCWQRSTSPSYMAEANGLQFDPDSVILDTQVPDLFPLSFLSSAYTCCANIGFSIAATDGRDYQKGKLISANASNIST